MRLVCDRLTNGVSKRNMASFIASATIELVYTVFLLETDVDFVSIGTPCYLTAITQGNIPFIFLSFSLIPPFTLPIPTFSFFPISPPPISNATQFSNYFHLDTQFSFKHNSSFLFQWWQVLCSSYSSLSYSHFKIFIQVLYTPLFNFFFNFYSKTKFYSSTIRDFVFTFYFIHVLFYSRSIQVFYSNSIHIFIFYYMDFPFINTWTIHAPTITTSNQISASFIHWIMILSQRWIRSVEHA